MVYIKGKKNVRVTMELEVPKRPIFKPTFIHYHDPTGFAMGEAKEVLSLQFSHDHGIEMTFF